MRVCLKESYSYQQVVGGELQTKAGHTESRGHDGQGQL